MKLRFFLSIAAVVAVSIASIQANDSRIAVVDMTKLFEKHPKTAPALARLSAVRDASNKRYRALSEELKGTLFSHQEQIRSNQKSAAVETLKKANELEKAIATLGTKEYRDTEEKFRQEKLAILKAIRDSIRSYNQSAKYALILDLSAASPTGLPQVVDASGCTDITETVLQLIYQGK